MAMTSTYLTHQKSVVKKLVKKLEKHFEFVSILGVDTNGKQIQVNRGGVNIEDSMWTERGFVVRVYLDNMYSEYAFNEISPKELDNIAMNIIDKTKIHHTIKDNVHVKLTDYQLIEEEKIKSSFIKNENETRDKLDLRSIVERLVSIKDDALNYSELLVNIILTFEQVNISKIYISSKKDLEQSYTWGNVTIVPVVRRELDTKYFYEGFSGLIPVTLLDELSKSYRSVIDISLKLLDSKKIIPGEYDVICEPDITGLIAHEAFGHGVEMDMFVKNRAKAIEYLGKEVASNLVTMHDGAVCGEEVSSYAFDDEGTLANDTIIIKNGILQAGISDTLSALRLGTKPTGNGKRQSFDRKAYSRMTNTFFASGTDKVEDMIKSIKNGYMITGMMSGMEDPKNWGIQCVAIMGKEIKDGKLTGELVSPIIMTGYVPDLLKSISMVSEHVELFGTGACGKGHKEFVKAADGGPFIKARVRIG